MFGGGGGGGGGGVKSHSGACEDKQSQREENDTNQLKHYCPLYSRLIRSSRGTGGLYRHEHPDTGPYNCCESWPESCTQCHLSSLSSE